MADQYPDPVAVRAAPLPKPSFTLDQIRAKLPKHLFEQNTLKSMLWLGHDIVLSVALILAVNWVDARVHPMARYVVWPVFWFLLGMVWTGIWVLAHECGHRAFSPHLWVNDAVGMILHSFLLVPFHSWRISHRNHHSFTNHMEKDTVFVPAKCGKGVSKLDQIKTATEETPIASFLSIFSMLTVGWPGYLLFNASGQTYEKRANHFEPSSPLFQECDAPQIVQSDIGIVVMLSFLAAFIGSQGWSAFLCYYFLPYLWVNHWLVLITYLQHTDVRVPHYKNSEWTKERGALSTIDRSYGILDYFFHNITDSHVVHHMWSNMPFFHAKQATELLKQSKALGPYYLSDHRPVATALWESWRACRFVDGNADVAFFKGN